MADNEENNGSIFPLINRQTPVIDRLKQRQQGNDDDTGNELASSLGETVGNTVISDNQESSNEKRMVAKEEFRNSLASTLGVEPSQIKDSFVNRVGDMFGNLKEKDILTENAIKQLGLSGGSEEEDVGVEEDGESFLDE